MVTGYLLPVRLVEGKADGSGRMYEDNRTELEAGLASTGIVILHEYVHPNHINYIYLSVSVQEATLKLYALLKNQNKKKYHSKQSLQTR